VFPIVFSAWSDTKFESTDDSKKLSEIEDIPWLKSRNMFNILMTDLSDNASFINALACNVW
jgi:hypothetical protein